MEIKTKRLRIVPLNIEQMALLCESRDKLDTALGHSISGAADYDDHLKKAFSEMHQSCILHPKEYLWYTNWQIILINENKSVGSIGFHGTPNEKYEVEIGYEIDETYQNQGIATEAVKKLCEWAFTQEVYYIQAYTEPNNEASKKVLIKCGFKQIEGKIDGEGNILHELEKPASAWTSIYMCLGLSMGLCFGTAFNNIGIGMCMGISVGVALGSSLDFADKKKRKR